MSLPPGESGLGGNVDRWYGLPRAIERERAGAVAAALRTLWHAQGKAAGARTDADITKAWFDPLARGARLRSAIDALPPASDIVPEWEQLAIDPPLTLQIDEGRLLVTMEGRAVGRLLEGLIADEPDALRIRLRWPDTDAVDRELLDNYRSAAMAKLDSVIALRTGDATPLLPQAIGQVLLLILNGNFGVDQALRRPTSALDQQAVDAAVATIVSEFAEALVPSKRGRTAGAYSLYSGYAISEARRRLGSDLAHNPLFLAPGSRQRVTERLVTELLRRGIARETAMRALDVLFERYNDLRPQLAQYGLAQGKPSDVAQLRGALMKAYDELERSA